MPNTIIHPYRKIIEKGRRYKLSYPEWREKYNNTGDRAPAENLLEHYRNTVYISGAIRAQLEGSVASWLNEQIYGVFSALYSMSVDTKRSKHHRAT